MAQFGIITDLRLDRDGESGESKGYGWVAYGDWRSTVLAVDNMNGVTLLGRKIGVDHALNYRPPSPSEGKTWWEQKLKAERKKLKKDKKKKRKKRDKKKLKIEPSPAMSGGLMVKSNPSQSLALGDDGSVYIKSEAK